MGVSDGLAGEEARLYRECGGEASMNALVGGLIGFVVGWFAGILYISMVD